MHHTKKKTEVSQSPLEQILGSTGITATVETILVMENVVGKKDRKLHVNGGYNRQPTVSLHLNDQAWHLWNEGARQTVVPWYAAYVFTE